MKFTAIVLLFIACNLLAGCAGAQRNPARTSSARAAYAPATVRQAESSQKKKKRKKDNYTRRKASRTMAAERRRPW